MGSNGEVVPLPGEGQGVAGFIGNFGHLVAVVQGKGILGEWGAFQLHGDFSQKPPAYA